MNQKFFVKCPSCRKKINYYASSYRPFCSERCKNLDMACWANNEYSIPGEKQTKNKSFDENEED